MIINMVMKHSRKTGIVLLSFLLIAVGTSYGASSAVKTDPNEWKKIVEAAKKEGKIVMSGDPTEVWRKSLVDNFQQEYPEIKVEYTGANGRNIWPRIRQERELGQKLWDLRNGGMDPLSIAAKRDGYLEPVRPLLLPEIADSRNWIGGLDSIFHDKEKKFMLMYTIYIERPAFVNRDFINESELKSSAQLLDPKFKGKIVMQTPTGGGTYQALGNLAYMYGENFVHDLLSKQSVVITDDKRQQAEWLVRGKYPIAVGLNGSQLITFLNQGLGKNITMLEDKITPFGTGGGGILVLEGAPHPNAVRVYINWLLSKNAQMKLTKNVTFNSRRSDVPPVDSKTAVDAAHFNSYYNDSTEENMDKNERLLPMIKESLPK